MEQWLILLIVVPMVVAPVVLLLGFAGCSFEHGVAGPPVIQSAIGTSVSIITLTWTYFSAPKFEFERTQLPVGDPEFFEAVASPYDDPGREPATSYQYRVRPIFMDGEPGEWSAPVIGTTLSFEETFSETLLADEAQWEGYCLVQRIEAVRLSRSGTQVKLTLRASSVSNASIDRIYISRPDPAGDPYDSDTDLTAVTTALLVVPANTAVTLPAINYNLDETQALLIAVDFSAAPPSAIAYRDAVPPDQGIGYWRGGGEAALRNRTASYTPENRIYLIEKIEIG
jgi:hypothetical protein